ncbi:hypothetical protein B0H19DRAFT_1229718 [Mycena capillaripes]|nr:hypothetical protein B0H19DRAFT_1229718 [Mycena capillaripes]
MPDSSGGCQPSQKRNANSTTQIRDSLELDCLGTQTSLLGGLCGHTVGPGEERKTKSKVKTSDESEMTFGSQTPIKRSGAKAEVEDELGFKSNEVENTLKSELTRVPLNSSRRQARPTCNAVVKVSSSRERPHIAGRNSHEELPTDLDGGRGTQGRPPLSHTKRVGRRFSGSIQSSRKSKLMTRHFKLTQVEDFIPKTLPSLQCYTLQDP